MSFLKDVKNKFFGQDLTLSPYRIELIAGVGCYIEGALSLIKFSKEKIELKVKKGILYIDGENLAIKKYFEKDFVILGDILSIKVENERQKK
jgi:sporulation protein YqfC